MMQLDPRRRSALMVAIAGVIAAGVAWLLLAVATGLVFHLMPAGPPLLGAFLLRRGQLRSWTEIVAVIGAGAVVSLAVALALSQLGLPLDDPEWTIGLLGIGAGLGTKLARWPLTAATVE
jgi:small-conductance mechanosensitive channel